MAVERSQDHGGAAGGSSAPEPGVTEYLGVALAWLVPGAGHFLIGEKRRGVIFLITIHALFAAGLFIGGIKCINPPDQQIWSVTQFLCGWTMIAANIVQHAMVQNMPTDYSPRIQEMGSVYCGIAGMLNMLVMFDVLLRVSGGRSTPAPEEAVGSAGGEKV